MRRILVDYARSRIRDKRGGGAVHVDIEEGRLPAPDADPAGLIALDRALQRLESLDDRKARVIELHYFGGCTYDEMARALEISPATVHRDLRLARAWLYVQLNEEPDDG